MDRRAEDVDHAADAGTCAPFRRNHVADGEVRELLRVGYVNGVVLREYLALLREKLDFEKTFSDFNANRAHPCTAHVGLVLGDFHFLRNHAVFICDVVGDDIVDRAPDAAVGILSEIADAPALPEELTNAVGILADGVTFDRPFRKLGSDDGALFTETASNDALEDWIVDPPAPLSGDEVRADSPNIVTPGARNYRQRFPLFTR